MLTGSIVNALAVLMGSAAGMLLKWGTGKFSSHISENAAAMGERMQNIVMQGLALCVLYIGISGSLKGENTLIAILSMVAGALIGELVDLDRRMKALGDWLQKKTEKLRICNAETSISEGFVTASLVFCVGAMSIVGALDDGLTGTHDMLFAKSLLDGVTAVVFSASLGLGVALAAVVVFLYQGSIAVLASCLAPFLGDAVIGEMTFVGSLTIIALGLNMLGLTRVKVMNLVPAIFLPILLCRL